MIKINVSKLDISEEKSFSLKLCAEELELETDSSSIEGEISIEGTVTFTGRVYRLQGIVRAQRFFICDRCLGEFNRQEEYPFAEEFVRLGETSVKDDKLSVFTGDYIELNELLRDTILTAQPLRNLCRPDCLGLCLKCGADLNNGDCGCDRRVVNPKLAALQDLIKE